MEVKIVAVITHWMEGEINNFIKVWLSAILSITYCYYAAAMLRKGPPRLAAFLPVIGLLLVLPLQLRSMHLCGFTAFFLAWLAVFKLLMFTYGIGPLAADSISLPEFIAVACLPIKLRTQESQETIPHKKGSKSILNYAIKLILLAFVIIGYGYVDHMHSKIVLFMYGLHIYLLLEIQLAVAAAAARLLLGVELEPHFDEPYLSASLQDFWGRRWNLMVTGILRPTVYFPVLRWSAVVMGRKWASLPAVMATFAVSGLMHELIFYYFGHVQPTWEVTGFFLLHGSCLALEIIIKRAVNGRLRLPRVAGAILTVGFVAITAFWLFFPPFLRCKADERGQAEIAAVGEFVNDVVSALGFKVNSEEFT
ncbi:acyl-CoA--sterol O-acyltransferase 1-like [Andrographis paniculata]|uniref:acyl-CoA--sterol O-acyltransferase 1-like n=1 Tax=Andrographis paniculata TaxID=175694 RepID=UPI0021E8E5B6|nr:acyl-CoA--sterol O-acyltransferase 1-like [Andrographis paniculata]